MGISAVYRYAVPLVDKHMSVCNVQSYGAQGDGATDDTSAIQAAVDAANAAGGGTVFFPTGTYLVRVDPASKIAVYIYPKVSLRGAGRDSTVVKLAANQGTFEAMFAGKTKSTDLTGFSMFDLTVNMNASSNPVGTKAEVEVNGGRIALRIFSGRRLVVQRCRFTDMNNINGLTFNGVAVSDVLVANNVFDLIGGVAGTDADHDHSTVYTNAVRVHIVDNVFIGKALGSPGARTAIETHGSDHTIRGNVIRDFGKGMNITGVADKSDNVLVVDNQMTGVYGGIALWVYFYGGNVSEPGLRNCTISNNQIILERDAWDSLITGPCTGIGLERLGTAPIDGLSIVGNFVRFNASSLPGHTYDNAAFGIDLSRNDTTIVDGNVRITDNHIEGALAGGVRSLLTARKLRISRNTVVNCGRTKYAINDDYKAGVTVGGVCHDVLVNQNLLVDDQSPATMRLGVYASLGVGSLNFEIKDNNMRIASGEVIRCILPPPTGGAHSPLVVSFVVDNLSAVSYPVRYGSTVIETSTGNSWTQVARPWGAVWRRKAHAGLIPTSGTWGIGDSVENYSPVDGGSMGWVCTRAGDAAPFWQPSTAYKVNDLTAPAVYNTKNFKCVTAGTSGPSQPPFTAGAAAGTTWNDPNVTTVWSAGANVALSVMVVPTAGNGWYYVCSQAGATGATEPNWASVTVEGQEIADGTAKWKGYKTAVWQQGGEICIFKEYGLISK